ncbi:MAG: Rrf2 family transcriptional regulator [Solirubrobacterales bacterium]|nr:Rrf2 family transcriptional regulator [Solirubrobacterales bacterium]
MSIITDVERQVRERIKELEPLIAEHRQLQEVLETFERSKGQNGRKAARSERKPARRQSRASTARRGSGRADEALKLVAATPGITVAELAKKMKIGPTYLYRLLPALEREGKVKKDGKGYHATAA